MIGIKLPSSRGHRVGCAVCGKAVDEYQILYSDQAARIVIATLCHGHFDCLVLSETTMRVFDSNMAMRPDDELHAPPVMAYLEPAVEERGSPVIYSRRAVQKFAQTMGDMHMSRFGLPSVWQDYRRKARTPTLAKIRKRKLDYEVAENFAPGALSRSKRRMDP